MPNLDVQGYISLDSNPDSKYDLYCKFNEKSIKILQFEDEVPLEYFIFFKDDIINLYKGSNKEKNMHQLNVVHKNHNTLYILNLDIKQYCLLFELFFDWLECDTWVNKTKGVNKAKSVSVL